MEEILATIGDLMKEFAQEEMQDCLDSFLEDVGPLMVLLTKNPQLRQLVEAQLLTQFDELA